MKVLVQRCVKEIRRVLSQWENLPGKIIEPPSAPLFLTLPFCAKQTHRGECEGQLLTVVGGQGSEVTFCVKDYKCTFTSMKLCN